MAKKMKVRTLAEMKDKYIGKVGSKERDNYEYDLRMDVLGKMIKAARQERNMTQEEWNIYVGKDDPNFPYETTCPNLLIKPY